MKEELLTENPNIPYKVKVSRRAKRMRIAVYSDSSVVLTLPFGFREFNAQKFISKKELDFKSLKYFSRFKGRVVVKLPRKDYVKNRAAALHLAKLKVEQWNKFYNLPYNKVNIKNQKTRWGSCSRKGNLNFNYKIVHLSENLVDYLVVHELCHLKEFNHSRNFWNMVGQTIPNYKAVRAQLKNFGTVQ